MIRVQGSGFRVYGVIFFLFLLSTAFFLSPVPCHLNPVFAQPVSSNELINNAKHYDGKIMDYEGEVIGEVMPRGEFVWVNVYDGSNAIGIWLRRDLTSGIVYAGSYKARGDWVAVTGIFHKNCPEHGGDLDIHAQAIHTLKAGRVTPEKLNFAKINQAIALGAICLLIWILTLLRRR